MSQADATALQPVEWIGKSQNVSHMVKLNMVSGELFHVCVCLQGYVMNPTFKTSQSYWSKKMGWGMGSQDGGKLGDYRRRGQRTVGDAIGCVRSYSAL